MDFVQRRFDVVGDLTLGGGITSLKWRGGSFLEGLESQSKKGYTWGEMVTAAAYEQVLRKVGEGKNASDSQPEGWEGKATKDMTSEEKKKMELARVLSFR